jgi:CheY-like chemotaxis protein
MHTELVDKIAGLRFALAGFHSEREAHLHSVLSEAGGFCRSLQLDKPSQNSRALKPFDIAIMDSDTIADEILLASARIKPVLLIAKLQQLLQRAPGWRESAIDFLLEPWKAEDLLLRCLHLRSLAEHQSEHRREPSARPTPTAVIVMADDDPTTRVIVSTTLKNSAMDCHAVADGQEALQAVHELKPDALVLDVNMPKLDGFEVLATIRREALTAQLPVLILTSRQHEADVLRGFALGASDYVVKPFNPMELAARLRRLLQP